MGHRSGNEHGGARATPSPPAASGYVRRPSFLAKSKTFLLPSGAPRLKCGAVRLVALVPHVAFPPQLTTALSACNLCTIGMAFNLTSSAKGVRRSESGKEKKSIQAREESRVVAAAYVGGGGRQRAATRRGWPLGRG